MRNFWNTMCTVAAIGAAFSLIVSVIFAIGTDDQPRNWIAAAIAAWVTLGFIMLGCLSETTYNELGGKNGRKV